jgi:transposase-like protein/transposase Tn5 family protein
MQDTSHQMDPQPWAEQQFAAVQVSDVRRAKRVRKIAAAMATNPGQSIPQQCPTPYDVKATYTFLRHAEATPDNLQAGHREVVKEELQRPGAYLLLEDTTDLGWSGKQPIEGLGPVGNGLEGQQGFQLHTVLAVGWPSAAGRGEGGQRPAVEVVGVCDQQYHARGLQPVGARRTSLLNRHKRERESQVWERAGERVGRAPASPGVRWVRVCDRGADIYEHLQTCRELGHGFVVRAAQDRALVDATTGQKVDRLFPAARAVTALGEVELELRSRRPQPARRARLRVGTSPVCLGAPQRPGHPQGSQPPIACTVVRVWEVEAPASVEPLEGVLLYDAAVDTFPQALECMLQYAARWIIEEYHKALKSGLGAERLQLETAAGLMAAIAIMSIVALRLLDLRERVRLHPEAPAEEAGLGPLELQVLQLQARIVLHTVQDVALAIGRLGGHLNRRGDGMPGWQTLWRGMTTLRTLVEGVRLAHRVKQFG